MQTIKWTEDLCIGNPTIDQQHKDIINTASKLFDSIIRGRESSVIKSVLLELDNYIKIHFSYEEEFFMKYNYPKTEEHIKGHRAFEKKYNEILENFSGVNLLDNKDKLDDVVIEVTNLLGSWVTEHIQKEIKESNNFWAEVQKKNN